jgi:hypothetical protein
LMHCRPLDSLLSLARAQRDAALRATLEADARRMADELDLARDAAARLRAAEAALERYRARLEELAPLREHARELEQQSAQYLDQVGAPVCMRPSQGVLVGCSFTVERGWRRCARASWASRAHSICTMCARVCMHSRCRSFLRCDPMLQRCCLRR